jgi:hypothetical protein
LVIIIRLLMALTISSLMIGPRSQEALAIENTLDGFQGAKWGMAEDAVQRAFGGILTRWTSKSDDGLHSFQHFGIPSYDIGGCAFYVDFGFSSGKLDAVDLGLKDKRQLGCGTKITEVLTAKYGTATINEPINIPYSTGHKRVWFVGKTKITQFESYFSGLGTVVMGFTTAQLFPKQPGGFEPVLLPALRVPHPRHQCADRTAGPKSG